MRFACPGCVQNSKRELRAGAKPLPELVTGRPHDAAQTSGAGPAHLL